jgi:Fe-Mn family superoxide dismutase
VAFSDGKNFTVSRDYPRDIGNFSLFLKLNNNQNMAYKPKNFEYLLGIEGLSDQLLKNHFILYQGYVTNINKLLETMMTMMKERKLETQACAELKRRFGWEWNGMRLHEYYFENLTKVSNVLDKESNLAKKISEDFGSYENWEKDFRATGAMRGIGWAALYYDVEGKGLFNVWIGEHDVAHLSGAKPLLIMDVFEHAYMIDYGVKRPGYIEAFFKAIDWKAVAKRFDEANK